jgi:hypothetical protein
MKNIKQIRENYNLITEKEEADTRKLVSLVRAGLFDAKKLPLLKRALEKDTLKMTPAERKVLIELLDSLMGEVLSSPQVYTKVKQSVSHKDRLDEAKENYLSKYDPRYEVDVVEKDLPSVIILKRKAIRNFPGKQKIGLYYSQALDRYVSIPFGPGLPTMSEETTQVAQAHYGDEPKKKKKERDGVDYDAPRKPGQLSNLTKGWIKGDVSNTEYFAAKAGKAIHNIFARKKSVSQAQPKKELTKDQEAVKASANKRIASAKITGRKSREPGISAKQRQSRISTARKTASYALLDKRKAGIIESFKLRLQEKRELQEVAFIPPIAAGISAASRVIPAAQAGYRAFQASRAARAAAKTAEAAAKTTKPAGLRKGTRWERTKARIRRNLRKADAAGGGADALDAGQGDNTPGQTGLEKKELTPTPFSMKVNVSAPKATRATTGVDRRMDIATRKSLEQTVSESIRNIAKGTHDSIDLVIGEEKITINTNIAKKIDTLYESLSSKNKKQMNKMLNEGDIKAFKKILDFAVRQ